MCGSDKPTMRSVCYELRSLAVLVVAEYDEWSKYGPVTTAVIVAGWCSLLKMTASLSAIV